MKNGLRCGKSSEDSTAMLHLTCSSLRYRNLTCSCLHIRRLWDAIAQPPKTPILSHAQRRLPILTKARTNENLHDIPPLPLSNLSSFLILPSIREIRVAHGLANREHHSRKPFIWRHPSCPYSNVERIELVRSCVEGVELAKLLCHCPRLRVFRLGYATKWHGCGME